MPAFDPSEFLTFTLVGFLAQLVDGALGMAYGVVSSTVLLSFGVLPAQASASVHAAELFTTAASGGSHLLHRNIDWRLFRRLAPAGVAGGVLGTYVLTSIDGAVLRPYVAAYLAAMGLVILWRAYRPPRPDQAVPLALVPPVGAFGGFADAVGGGGWGPVVTTFLVGAGAQPRYAIGTVNAAEFLVTLAVSVSFVVAIATGHWDEADGLATYAWPVAGLVAGGLLAAPLAGRMVRRVPARTLTALVGVLVLALAGYQAARLLR